MKLTRITNSSLDECILIANEFMKDKVIINSQVLQDGYNYTIVILYADVNEKKKPGPKPKENDPTTPSQKKG